MKNVLITGANRSIGLESARQLLQNGYFVWIGSRDIAKGNAVVENFKSQGFTSAAAVALDVTDADSVREAAKTITKQSGTLDVLINNAGILGGMAQLAGSVPLDTVREVFDTNFFGVIQVTEAFLPLLRKSTQPVIVNVTSGLGSLTLQSDPNWHHYTVKTAAYGPSKSALNAYTITLAYELKDAGFKVNAVDPGYTATDFNNHSGPTDVKDAAAHIIKYAMLGPDGPTGMFFSEDNDPVTGVSPW